MVFTCPIFNRKAAPCCPPVGCSRGARCLGASSRRPPCRPLSVRPGQAAVGGCALRSVQAHGWGCGYFPGFGRDSQDSAWTSGLSCARRLWESSPEVALPGQGAGGLLLLLAAVHWPQLGVSHPRGSVPRVPGNGVLCEQLGLLRVLPAALPLCPGSAFTSPGPASFREQEETCQAQQGLSSRWFCPKT